MARNPNPPSGKPTPPETGAESAAGEGARMTAEQIAQADREFAAAAAQAQSPTSAQLEPVVSNRARRDTRVIEERVAVRTETIGFGTALDAIAPLFPATARVLPGGEVVASKPAEEIDGERREVRIVSRVLHDGVDYSPMTTPRVTRAQFEALRLAGATGEQLWEQLA